MSSQNEAFKMLREELRSGFTTLTNEVRSTNQRLDDTNKRLEVTNTELTAFRKDVSKKLDGIGKYLRSINGNVQDHSDRIFKLEQRVDDIEKSLGA